MLEDSTGSKTKVLASVTGLLAGIGVIAFQLLGQFVAQTELAMLATNRVQPAQSTTTFTFSGAPLRGRKYRS